MNLATIKSPGVYINELDGFGNAVVPIATAVPAFIGYTPQASYEGVSYTNVPKKITSFAEFQAIFCYPDPAAPADPSKQYKPEYYLVKQKEQPEKGQYVTISGDFYSILPDPNTIYYLYNSIKLFYDNGGGDAYIVSVGTYGLPSGKPIDLGAQIINTNVQLNELTAGLALLKNEQDPTLYICPEATLLTVENNGSLMQAMMAQSATLQTSISIFDIIGGHNSDLLNYGDHIDKFRNHTGVNNLEYGAAYFPFVCTTIMQISDIDYTNIFGGDITQLEPLLNPVADPNPAASTILTNSKSQELTVSQYNNALLVASPTYSTIMNTILSEANILPPSGGMAGVITTVDNNVGPWQAPANRSMNSVSGLPLNLSESQQGPLNVDAVSGKSINVIRTFNGRGTLIWGARTLDGNSNDWKYLSVRRTVTYIEQSCKLAAQAYVFEPNNKNTWESVKAMISSFLTGAWNQGALQGAKPSDAFSVECGLGSTMTSEDLLLGFMNVTIKIAVTKPAEFIVLTFQQQQATSS
nr:phage tail sheath C-terminal domain-containing protein [uncultured Psychroserpens sp.]